MREIRFKAKRKDNGEWIEGYYNGRHIVNWKKREVPVSVTESKKCKIQNMHTVIPETVCQYTGLKDKDGQEIWENDIIDDWNGGTSVVKFGKFEIEDEHDYLTMEINGWYVDFINTNYASELSNAEIRFNHFLVVGNIFDNSGLLEGSHDKNN